jgi:hypothetical protein
MPISRNRRLVDDATLATLFSAFEEGTQLSEHGLSYQRLDFLELYEILPDAFSVRPAISRSEAIDLFGQALRDCRHAGPLTAEAMIRRATSIQRTRLAIPQRCYTLWTKFRAQNMAHSPGFRLNWRGVLVRSASSLPAWLDLDEYFLNGVGRIFPRQPHSYGHIILSCEDRREDRAVDRMMDALQLILGLINMYETWGRYSHWGGRNWTEGGLWLGPHQFVFERRKFRGEERIWYNPDFDKDAWNRHPPRMPRVLQIIPRVRRALAALDGHPFCDILTRAIMLLQDGFATRDSSHRLLRYWSALEQLYVEADAKGRSNEKVLERATFADLDPALSTWKLEHIARLRNDYVHAGGSDDDLHPLCQFLRDWLGRHINHWIFNGGDLADHAAMLQFVKLPGDRITLASMRDIIDRRIAFIDSAPPPPATEED